MILDEEMTGHTATPEFCSFSSSCGGIPRILGSIHVFYIKDIEDVMSRIKLPWEPR